MKIFNSLLNDSSASERALELPQRVKGVAIISAAISLIVAGTALLACVAFQLTSSCSVIAGGLACLGVAVVLLILCLVYFLSINRVLHQNLALNRESLEKISKERDSLLEANSELTTEKNSLETKNLNLKQELDDCKRILCTTEDNRDSLLKEGALQKEEISALEIQNKELLEERDDLRLKNEGLSTEVTKLKAESDKRKKSPMYGYYSGLKTT